MNRQTTQRDKKKSHVQVKERKYRSALLKPPLAVSCLLIKALIWLVEGKERGMCGDKTSELNNTIRELSVLKASPES